MDVEEMRGEKSPVSSVMVCYCIKHLALWVPQDCPFNLGQRRVLRSDHIPFPSKDLEVLINDYLPTSPPLLPFPPFHITSSPLVDISQKSFCLIISRAAYFLWERQRW